jgi:hypothetical protein
MKLRRFFTVTEAEQVYVGRWAKTLTSAESGSTETAAAGGERLPEYTNWYGLAVADDEDIAMLMLDVSVVAAIEASSLSRILAVPLQSRDGQRDSTTDLAYK